MPLFFDPKENAQKKVLLKALLWFVKRCYEDHEDLYKIFRDYTKWYQKVLVFNLSQTWQKFC